MSAFNICIQNLGKYNEGELLFKWVEMPCTDEEMNEALDFIEISHDDKVYTDDFGCPYEELMIADWECRFSGLVGEWSNLSDLNEKAETLDSLSAEEMDIVEALMDYHDFEEALEIVSNGDYVLYSGCNDMSDVAYQIVEESGMLNGVNSHLANYFDYAAYGRDLDIEGEFIQTSDGIIEVLR